MQQKDLDARWVKKNGINHYGYKNNICIDVEHGFIRRYAVTPANIHDSQMLPMLLDPENTDDYVWADSAYAGKCFEGLLTLGGFVSCIHEKGSRNHPLSEAAKERNRIISAIRGCVEHVFVCITMSVGGKITRKIGLETSKAWWGAAHAQGYSVANDSCVSSCQMFLSPSRDNLPFLGLQPAQNSHKKEAEQPPDLLCAHQPSESRAPTSGPHRAG